MITDTIICYESYKKLQNQIYNAVMKLIFISHAILSKQIIFCIISIIYKVRYVKVKNDFV